MQHAVELLDDRILSTRISPRTPRMLTLRIADIVVTLATTDPALPLAAGGASERFVVDGQVAADVTVHASLADALSEPSGRPLFDSDSAWRLYPYGNGCIFSFRSTTLRHVPYRIARFDPRFTMADVVVTREFARGYPDGVPALQYPLDELLWSHLLAQGRGVEIHSCGVIDEDGYGVLFPGQSGAGKSTIARPWHEQRATVLSDDRVIVRLRGGRPWIYGTPWHGDEQLASAAAAPLKRILFLARGPIHAVTPVSPAQAAARLLSCAFPPFHDRAAIEFTTRVLGEIATAVPCGELAFVPEPSVVPFVRGLGR